jgi:hypothetical protein
MSVVTQREEEVNHAHEYWILEMKNLLILCVIFGCQLLAPEVFQG